MKIRFKTQQIVELVYEFESETIDLKDYSNVRLQCLNAISEENYIGKNFVSNILMSKTVEVIK